MNDKKEVDNPQVDNPRTCDACMFVNRSAMTGPQGEIIFGSVQLTCMRRPPIPVAVVQQSPLGNTTGLVSQFPPVTAKMYCFDFWPADEPMPAPDALSMIKGETVAD